MKSGSDTGTDKPKRRRVAPAENSMRRIAGLLLISALFLGPGAANTQADDRPTAERTFEVPSEEARIRAIGPMRGLSPTMRRALDPVSSFFEPISAPGPGDWLAAHRERGETFRQFVRSRPNRPDRRRNTIYLLPLGEFEPEKSPDLEDLKACAVAFFGMNVQLLPALSLEDHQLTSRINSSTGRRQYLTGDILGILQRQLPRDAYCTLAVTMEDLYPQESWNFVFGLASLRNRVGIFSFARYDPSFDGSEPAPGDRQTLLRRSCRVLVHETSHMFGMQHCIYFNCVMNGANHLQEFDARPMHLCPVCLRKLFWSTGSDVKERYERLQAAYREIGLPDEAAWLANRLEQLEPSGTDR
jgi:archaemetzincin